ncbi:MAG: uncharacterized protein KVP18_003180 [Porospora cf. gigantea A]|uniref:uncharacterized protein n=2 Tax=Porospora cf. gigantea A TaxID=2853593 RepID=UPI00355A6888|nr:MAG: hypothetical protein KVP18_003180 [Porospora cf. gigantea A]
MANGPRFHLKRINTPKYWYVSKMNGIFAPRPVSGPHKKRECLPLALLLRDRLKYALTYEECKQILRLRNVKVDDKVRTERRFPLGIMDVVSIEKSNEHFRMLMDPKGRFVAHAIPKEEATYKLLRVNDVKTGIKNIRQAVTHDGRTIRYLQPGVKKNDSMLFDLKEKTIKQVIKFAPGNLCFVIKGTNAGRVGKIAHIDTPVGAEMSVSITDAKNHKFITLARNVMVLGEGNKSVITLPRGMGVRLSNTEDRALKLHSRQK